MSRRERVFVDERKDTAIRHFLQFAEPEAKQDTLFDPGVDCPCAADILRRANFATGQTGAEVKEGSPRIGRIGDGGGSRKSLDVCFE